MRSCQLPAALLGLSLAAAVPGRATTVFNDTFNGGSTVNSITPEPANPSLGAAAYQQVTSKTFSPNPPTLASGNFTFGMVSTSSGFCSVEALFTKYPLKVANTGDYLEATVTFTAQGGILTAQANSTLFFGLYNSSGIQPKPGGLNATSNAALAGFAASWQGYCSRIFYTGGSNGIYTRPAQTDAGANNQDLLFQYSSASVVGSTATSTLTGLTTGAQYTEVYRISRSGATALTITSTLYAGPAATGTPLFSQSGASTSVLTDTFDAIAIGWRGTGSVASSMSVNAITVTTNVPTTIVPVIESAPLGQTKGVGENVDLAVIANGGGAPGAELSYQWFKDDVEIPLAENATAKSATLQIASAAVGHTGSYKVTVTNAIGAVTSTPVLLTVTGSPIPPTILTEPTGATILTGGAKTFSVLANGSGTLTYQWEFSSDGGTTYTPLSGATGASHEITGAKLTDAGNYRCVITNAVGSATTVPAILIVNEAPKIVTQPQGATLAIGAPLTLAVTATGTPAPTFQWRKNGVNIDGATNSTYTVASVTGADTGGYSVVIGNVVSSVTSDTAGVAVLSPTFSTSAFAPTVAPVNPDTRLAITFNGPVSAGVSGFLKIHDASTDAVVDTIDFAAASALRATLRAGSTVSTLNLPVQNQSIGGVTNFNYYPLTISGNTVTIHPRNGVLARGKNYYVKITPGAFVNAGGESFPGIDNSTAWTFATRSSAPAADAAALTVAADGSGDFDTVQGALDWIPNGNTAPRTIFIRNGAYFEQVVFTNKHFLTLRGEDRSGTSIVYPNNNNFNNVSGFYHRSTFIASGVHDINVLNLTFRNTTPQGGSQAESFIITGSTVFGGRNLVTQCDFRSFQDTIQINRQCYLSDCYIEGDTDFMWGSGPAFFENCELRMLRSGAYYNQVRNDSGNHGFVFSNCRFTAGAGFTGNYINRIDPRASGFPYSEVVLMNCRIGDAGNNAFLNTSVGANGGDFRAGWWLLNGTNSATTDTANIRNWDFNTTDANGTSLDFANRPQFTLTPLDPVVLANYSNPTWVLNTTWSGVVSGNWTPALPIAFLKQPQGRTAAAGSEVTFSAVAAAVPGATYQWYRDDAPIPGATGASHRIAAAGGADWGVYKVIATSGSASLTSDPATLVPTGSPIANPTADSDGDGSIDLMEYAFGTETAGGVGGPIQYAAGAVGKRGLPVLVPTAPSGYNVVFGRRRNYQAAGLMYAVQFSADLAEWVEALAPPVVVATDGGIDAVSVPFPVSIPTASGSVAPKFFRVCTGGH